MNFKKFILPVAILGLITLCSSPPVQAAEYAWNRIPGTVTNTVPDNSTTTVLMGNAITVTRYKEIGVSASFALDAAGTNACTFKFATSLDGTNYQTTAPLLMTLTPAGPTAVHTNCTFQLGAAGYFKMISITCGNNSAAMTNIIVGYSLKPNRRDE